jgi:hypothetical protein
MVEMQEHATALADAVEAVLPGWVERSVARRMSEAGRSHTDREVVAAATAAGERAQQEVGRRVRELLDADIDEQRTTPLSLLREAVRYPTEVLRAAGVEPVERDEIQERLFPDDVYNLAPATFSDVDPALADPGIAWGAAKAWTHRQRHGGVRA